MRASLLAAAALLGLAACTQSTTSDPPVDTPDASTGGGVDAAVADAAVARDAGGSSGDAAVGMDAATSDAAMAVDAGNADAGSADAAGAQDAGEDAGVDAGQDAGVDAGPVPVATALLDEDLEEVRMDATLPNGALVSVTFPPHSVREQVEVKMYAIPNVTLPVGTVLAGVRLEPDGLQLWAPATVRLEVPGTLVQRTTLGFGIHGGDVVYEATQVNHTTRQGQPVTQVDLTIYGFSDHGIADGPPQAAAAAATVAAPINQLRVDLLAAENEMDPTSEATARSMVLDEFYTTVVKPRLEDAATLPATLDGAMALYVEWRDQYNLMRTLNNAVTITADITEIETLLRSAIGNTMTHYNDACVSSLDWRDAQKTVDAWLWATVAHVDTLMGLRLEDLRAQLCIAMDILQQDLDAVLDANMPRPLTIRAGTKVNNNATQFDPRTRLRVSATQGGTVNANPTYTDATGRAVMDATLDTGDGLTAVITASAEGLRGIVSSIIRVFRPRRGSEQRLLIGRTYSGLVDISYDTRPFGCSPACGMDLCPAMPDNTGVLTVAGDPLGYQVQLEETVNGNPIPRIWQFAGVGTTNTFGGRGLTLDGDPSYAPFFTLTFTVQPDTGALTGLLSYSCQHYELVMTGMPTP